jgi:hypothetical protein
MCEALGFHGDEDASHGLLGCDTGYITTQKTVTWILNVFGLLIACFSAARKETSCKLCCFAADRSTQWAE